MVVVLGDELTRRAKGRGHREEAPPDLNREEKAPDVKPLVPDGSRSQIASRINETPSSFALFCPGKKKALKGFYLLHFPLPSQPQF